MFSIKEFKKLSLLEKIGTSLYLVNLFAIIEILKLILRSSGEGYFEKLYRGMKSEEETVIMNEVLFLTYTETCRQIWDYNVGNLSDKDGQRVLNILSTAFVASFPFDIDRLRLKYTEYYNADNPVHHLATCISCLAKDKDIVKVNDSDSVIAEIMVKKLHPEIKSILYSSKKELDSYYEELSYLMQRIG